MSIYDKASLVLIPSGTKTSKVYSQKPTNGDGDFTFSRSTAATRVNADGNIEKETQNLMTKSNTLSDWSNSGTAETGGQSGYDGSNDAWLVEKSAANGFIGISVSYSGVFTQSIYAKAGTLNWVALQNSGISQTLAWFDIQNGVTGLAQSSVISHSITDVGNGWYRCEATYNGTSGAFRVFPSVSDNNTSGTSGNIYIQDAQLEQGLVARDYIETTTAAVEGGITDNVPRLDYTDSSCPALLLEPQRTNLVPYSEYFETYTYYGSPTITHNDIASPEGLLNGTKVVRGTNAVPIRVQSITSLGTEYTMSIWAKAGTASQISIDIGNESAPTYDLTSEWQRFEVTSTPSSSTHIDITMPTASVGEYIYIYGLQLEAGSYATSYIPTYGSAVTRNGERPYVNGINNVIGGTEGTIFFDITTNKTLTSTNYKQFFYYTDSSSAQAYMYVSNNNYIVGNPNLGNIISNTQLAADTQYKIAITYKANDFKLYINGSQDKISTSGSVIDAENIISIGSYIGNSEFNEFRFNSYMHFQQVLSNEELATLTTI